MLEKQYHVNLWGSNPEANNDDCVTGEDFATEGDAIKVFSDPWAFFKKSYFGSCVRWVEFDGPNSWVARRLEADPDPVPDNSDDDWTREIAIQNGMAFGVEGYNDTYGW